MSLKFSKPEVVEIAELKLPAPSFRQRTRLVAHCQDEHVRFGLQYQHAGEPGAWIDDQSFPWHQRNLDSIIRTVVLHHDKIRNMLLKQQTNL
jgi:hypothetical protein